MAIETIQREGDFVIRNGASKAAFRFHAEEEGFSIDALQGRISLCDSEAKELMEWLQRRFDEPLRSF